MTGAFKIVWLFDRMYPVFQVSNMTEWRGHSRLCGCCLAGCVQSSRCPTWPGRTWTCWRCSSTSCPLVSSATSPSLPSSRLTTLSLCLYVLKPLLAFEIVCFEDVPWECRSRPLHFCHFAWCVRKSCSSIVSWAAFVPLSFHYRKKSALRKSWSMGCVWIIWLNIMWNIQWREVTNNCNKSLMV